MTTVTRELQLIRDLEVNHDDPTSYVLLGKGELTDSERQILTSLLDRFGISVEYQSPEAHVVYVQNQAKKYAYDIADLTSRDQYLVREHFLNFSRDYGRLTFMGRVFTALVDGKREEPLPPNTDKTITPMPQPGLLVVPRETVGLTPYTPPASASSDKAKFCAKFAIEAGSFIDYSQNVLCYQDMAVGEVVVRIAQQIQEQIDQTKNNAGNPL